jgi:hypothetical protein
MVPDLDAKLTPEEFASLREMGKRMMMQRIIPHAHKAKLLHLGFIEQKLGGLMLTNLGSFRIAKGI